MPLRESPSTQELRDAANRHVWLDDHDWSRSEANGGPMIAAKGDGVRVTDSEGARGSTRAADRAPSTSATGGRSSGTSSTSRLRRSTTCRSGLPFPPPSTSFASSRRSRRAP